MENRTPTNQLSEEASSQLQEGINLLFSRWTALQMAVQNEWGGRDSRQRSQQFALDIFSCLTQSKGKLYIDDLENMLDEFMLSLNTEIDDGSIEEIAEKIMFMHEECLEGNFSSIVQLKEIAPPTSAALQFKQAVNEDDDSSSDDDEEDVPRKDDASEMVIDNPESQPSLSEKDMMIDEPRLSEVAEAEDGWTVVGSRRSRGRRN
ncbi:unnamed protein product [Ilex paraguariensis]|uniref:Pre-rRNA-processing protein TSR2 homolog n=1 Tax=Ilex paraguariensis TaxID=185542 RepID=A0ABC8UCA9_9AQUA